MDDPTVDKVIFGELMGNIEMSNRWVYKGTLTRPPCERFVYWNVIDTIYPIDRATVDLLNAKLKQSGVKNVEGTNGNWRVIQQGLNMDVAYI